MRIYAAIAAVLVLACGDEGGNQTFELPFELPAHFPDPEVPADNPPTREAIELGRHLFYDPGLSGPGTISCSSCHRQERGFADDRPTSTGATGEVGVLNAPALGNAIYSDPLSWSHPHIARIEDQLVGPMFGMQPVEMAISGAENVVLARLREEPRYQDLFAAAFSGAQPDLQLARLALASFVRSLVTGGAPFDEFLRGDRAAVSSAARRGSELFYSEELGCGTCHAGFAFTSAAVSQSTSGQRSSVFHNTGLYNIDGEGGYPSAARGLIDDSGIARDMGRFRTPSLRNVALTAPYMHDGSVATLDEVVRIYEAGGRNIETGPNAGDGRASPLRSAELGDFTLSDGDRADLLEFLDSLTDVDFVTDPRHANPW